MPDIKSINNNMNQTMRRIIQNNNYYAEELYKYDNRGRLTNRTIKNKKGQIVSEEVSEISYDSFDHVERKVVTIYTYSDTIPQEAYKSQNTCNYFNTYDENNLLLEKSCKCNNKIVYRNKYFYENSQLIKIEKFDKESNLKFYECYSYLKKQCTVTIYIGNGVVSHTYVYELSDGQIIKRKLISPSNGKFKWMINHMDDLNLEIIIDEDQLTPVMLIEIVDHIIKLDGIGFVVINSDRTDVDTYQTELWQITNKALSKYNISIQFVM